MNKPFTGGWRKRPKDATPERARHLHDDESVTIRQIAAMWGISGAAVHELVSRGRREQPQPVAASKEG